MRAIEPHAASGNPAPARNAVLALMASGVVWGIAWWPLKLFARAGLTAHAICLSAYTVVALASLPLIWRERHRWQAERWHLLAIGLLFGAANFAFTAALTMGPVLRAMLLFYLLPAWGALGGALFLHERLGPRRLLAVALSLAGVFVIMGGASLFHQALSRADCMALAAGFCYSAAGIANRKASSIPILSRTLVAFSGCAVIAVAMLPWSSPSFPLLTPSTWLMLLLFTLVWLLAGTFLTTYGVTHIEASRAGVLQVIELLVAVVTAIWIGGEQPGLHDAMGGALIVAATLIEARNSS